MNYLVTGGAGFIGTNYVYFVLSRHPNDDVTVLDALDRAGVLAHREDTLRVVLEREDLMGTALGEGVAIPHGRLSRQTRLAVAFGRAAEGIDFDSPDGQPVRLVFLIVSPEQDQGQQVQALAAVSRAVMNPETRQILETTQDPEEVRRLFDHLQMTLKERRR